MTKYELFKQIIRECNYDNTYKMAWAKSLVEISTEIKSKDDMIRIDLERIAHKYIKYYWNQTIFFNLIQGSNSNKPPEILTIVKELIEEYYRLVDNRQPILYEKAEVKLEHNQYYINAVTKVTKVLKKDVSWRFLILNKMDTEVYVYSKKDDYLLVDKNLVQQLKENELDLYDLINYRWGMILETFNSSPRINKKVKIMDEREIRRSSLNKFKKYLDLVNKDHVCFICGKKIEEDELSIDHVIPWSYMYSDDIWNLVYVCKSCNSSKSNRIPKEIDVKKLIRRNADLLNEMDKQHETKNKMYAELKLANEKDYVNKFWIGSKG